MKSKASFVYCLIAFLTVSGTALYGQQLALPSFPGGESSPAGFGVDPANYRITVVGDDLAAGAPMSYQKSHCDGKACGGKGECCCPPTCWRVFGELLYLRARDAEISYGVESNSQNVPPTPQVQVQPVGVVDYEYQPGFRFGFGYALDPCSEITATFSMFENSAQDQISLVNNINQIWPMLAHPSTLTGTSGGDMARATQALYMDTIDLDYRQRIWTDYGAETTFVLGLRYGKLEHNLEAIYTDNLSQPEISVDTDIDFDGVGLKLGLEWERYHACKPIYVYAKGFTSILAGEYDATYTQVGNQLTTTQVDTGWKAGRLTPTLDFELGAGWVSSCGKYRITAGYMYSAWFNTVTTEEWIRSVQTNNFDDMGDTLTFDGFVARAEARF